MSVNGYTPNIRNIMRKVYELKSKQRYLKKQYDECEVKINAMSHEAKKIEYEMLKNTKRGANIIKKIEGSKNKISEEKENE